MIETTSTTTVKKRGFASMDPEAVKRIAQLGGFAAQKLGKAHKFTPEEAQLAGRKGGIAVSRNREHMVEIGKKGGYAAAGKPKTRNKNTNTNI